MPIPRGLGGVLGGWAFNFGRGTPVGSYDVVELTFEKPLKGTLAIKKTEEQDPHGRGWAGDTIAGIPPQHTEIAQCTQL